MGVIKALLSFLSYVFHGLLCLALVAMGGLALASGKTLDMGMLPWTGSTLLYVLFFGGLFGLVTVLLAIKGSWRPLFFVWSLAVVILLVKGYVFSSYRFPPGNYRTAIYLVVGSVVALLGSWAQMGRGTRRR